MFLNSFSRGEVLKDILLKLKTKNGSIIHNDIDGLLSAIYIYYKTGLSINGFFTINSQPYMKTELICENKNIIDCIFLDCSIINDKMLTIDHHTVTSEFYNDNNYNCNKFTIYNDILNSKNFYHKNPTGCINWLIYLFGENINSFTYKQKLLLILADSFYDNYNKYKNNCNDWIKVFKQEELYEVLNSPTLIEDIENLKKELGIVNQGYQTYTRSGFISHNTNKTTQEVINNICRIMEWDKLTLPTFKYNIIFDNYKCKLSERNIIVENKGFTSAIRTIKDGLNSDICFSVGKSIKSII